MFQPATGQTHHHGRGRPCVTNDANLARRIRLFVNKAWGYGDATPDHYFLAATIA